MLLVSSDAAPTSAQSEKQAGDFKAAVRVQTSLIAPLERACLEHLARRTPLWVGPDHLTLLGFAAMAMAGLFYMLARWWPPLLIGVNLCIALNWLGDSLDGTLARARNKQRPRYGFYVDHIIDALGTLFIVCGLAFSTYMTPMIAMALLVVYFLLSINVYLATYTIGTFKLSHFKISPTELRILLIAGNTFALLKPDVKLLGHSLLFFDVAAVAATVLMAAVLVHSVARNTIHLYRMERV